MPSTYGAAFEAAQAKAKTLGYRIRRTKVYPVLEVVLIVSGTVYFSGNLTKVERYLDQQEAVRLELEKQRETDKFWNRMEAARLGFPL